MKKEKILSSALFVLGMSLIASVVKKSSKTEPVMLQDRESIAAWLKKMNIQNYSISADLKVNVLGDVVLIDKKLRYLPVVFDSVSGSFNCSYNRLTSMKGMPQFVGNNFNCSYNKIKSLEGGPQEVGHWYECDNNALENLSGAPKVINTGFNCSSNRLKSLLGSPKLVRGCYFCNGNFLESLEGFPVDGKANQTIMIHNNKASLALYDKYYDKETNNLTIPVWDIIQKNAALNAPVSAPKYKH